MWSAARDRMLTIDDMHDITQDFVGRRLMEAIADVLPCRAIIPPTSATASRPFAATTSMLSIAAQR